MKTILFGINISNIKTYKIHLYRISTDKYLTINLIGSIVRIKDLNNNYIDDILILYKRLGDNGSYRLVDIYTQYVSYESAYLIFQIIENKLIDDMYLLMKYINSYFNINLLLHDKDVSNNIKTINRNYLIELLNKNILTIIDIKDRYNTIINTAINYSVYGTIIIISNIPEERKKLINKFIQFDKGLKYSEHKYINSKIYQISYANSNILIGDISLLFASFYKDIFLLFFIDHNEDYIDISLISSNKIFKKISSNNIYQIINVFNLIYNSYYIYISNTPHHELLLNTIYISSYSLYIDRKIYNKKLNNNLIHINDKKKIASNRSNSIMNNAFIKTIEEILKEYDEITVLIINSNEYGYHIICSICNSLIQHIYCMNSYIHIDIQIDRIIYLCNLCNILITHYSQLRCQCNMIKSNHIIIYPGNKYLRTYFKDINNIKFKYSNSIEKSTIKYYKKIDLIFDIYIRRIKDDKFHYLTYLQSINYILKNNSKNHIYTLLFKYIYYIYEDNGSFIQSIVKK